MKTSKKIWAIILSVLILFSLSACGCRHEWTDPSCEEDGFCVKCGEINIEAWGHDYYEGYCSHCSQKDPDFVDLNDFGFYNMYGMNMWIEISSYNLSSGYIYGETHSNGTRVIDFLDGYYKSYYKGAKDFNNGNLSSSGMRLVSNIVFSIIDNSSMNTERGSWTIFERDVDYSNKKVVLKTKYDGEEKWYVPVDLLDLDSATIIRDKNNFPKMKILFK